MLAKSAQIHGVARIQPTSNDSAMSLRGQRDADPP